MRNRPISSGGPLAFLLKLRPAIASEPNPSCSFYRPPKSNVGRCGRERLAQGLYASLSSSKPLLKVRSPAFVRQLNATRQPKVMSG